MSVFDARYTCDSIMPGDFGSQVLMKSSAAFMLSVLMVIFFPGAILLPCDTIKYRCGEER